MRIVRLILLTLVTAGAAAGAEAGPCAAAPATLLEPASGATNLPSPVVFRWSAVDGAEGYRVWLIEEELDLDVVAETSLTTAETRVEPGAHAWFVETLFADCESTRSEIFFFEAGRAANCSTLAPLPLAPAVGEEVRSPVTLIWTPIPGAIGYEVSAALDDGEPVFVGETAGTSLTASLGEGNVRWEVEAEFDGCDETISPPASFVVPRDPACRNDAPFLIAPAFGATTPTRADFLWTAVAGATSYRVLLYTDGNDDVRTLGTTTATRMSASVPAGPVFWAVVAELEGCPTESSPISLFHAAASDECNAPGAPEVFAAPRALSGLPYTLVWSAGRDAALYEIQESTDERFIDVSTRMSSDIARAFSHEETAATRYHYRVRGLSRCGLGVGPFSKTATVDVAPTVIDAARDVEIAAPYGEPGAIAQRICIPGAEAPTPFTAQTDKPWLAVSPSSGIIPPEGLDLTITARPRDLAVGSNTATLTLTDAAAGKIAGTSPATALPVSVNLMTPVSPNASNSPLPNSLIIPAIAHLAGSANPFESDVRILNTAAQVVKYLLNFTPTRSDGTKQGQQATIQIEPGATAALDRVLKNFFAAGSEGAIGVLEIRPVLTAGTAAPNKAGNATFASSRTYTIGLLGTYGQYIPAIPYSEFIGKGSGARRPPTLSLQQIAQSASYRTNLGLVEAAGQPATVVVSLFGDDGRKRLERVLALKPGEHLQTGDLFAGETVSSGRIEVAVGSDGGRVTAYASVLDRRSGDPMLVLPIDVTRVETDRIVLPGIAHLDSGTARWRSDIRLHNADSRDAEITLMYVPQGSTSGPEVTRTLHAGEVVQLDNALESVFDAPNSGGAVLVTSDDGLALVASAHTYNLAPDGGTYGQFIPGITEEDGVGLGDRALQILQVEESPRFRTNLGVVELTGEPVAVEVSAIVPHATVVPKLRFTLQGNEFRQIPRVLRALGLPATYNGRLTLKVVDGDGRAGGYASLIDNGTNDPTYVPAQ